MKEINYPNSDNSVMEHLPAPGYVGLFTVIGWIEFETWTWVIVEVDRFITVSQQIEGSWWTDYRSEDLPIPGYITFSSAITY